MVECGLQGLHYVSPSVLIIIDAFLSTLKQSIHIPSRILIGEHLFLRQLMSTGDYRHHSPPQTLISQQEARMATPQERLLCHFLQ